MNVITDADIRRQVLDGLPTHDAELMRGIDVDGIVETIQREHGLVDIDTIDPDAFWAIVARHDATQQ